MLSSGLASSTTKSATMSCSIDAPPHLPEDRRGVPGGRDDGVHRRQPGFHHQLELAVIGECVKVILHGAGIAAEAEEHAGRLQAGHALLHAVVDRRRSLDALLRASAVGRAQALELGVPTRSLEQRIVEPGRRRQVRAVLAHGEVGQHECAARLHGRRERLVHRQVARQVCEAVDAPARRAASRRPGSTRGR